MSKVLDLSVFAEDTFDITMPNGDIVKVRKPTQAIVIALMELSQAQKINDSEELINRMVEFCSVVLNNNKEGKQYSADWIAENLDFTMVSAIVQGYSEFIAEIQSNPI